MTAGTIHDTQKKRTPEAIQWLRFFDGTPDLDGIAPTLKSLSRWTPWRKEVTEERVNKIPCDVATGRRCNIHDPAHWHTLPDAYAGMRKHKRNGIGFFPGDGIAAVDLDKCRNPQTGDIAPWALDIVKRLGGYWEISPSKTGLRGWFVYRGNPLPSLNYQKSGIEFHFGLGGNFCTVTGRRLDFATSDLTDATDALCELYNETLAKREAERQTQQTQEEGATRPEPRADRLDLSDAALLDKARRNPKTGADFASLYDNGDRSQRDDDHSKADKDLLEYLAYWTAKDAARMETLFSASALGQRDKWRDRADYRERSIRYAINHTSRIYQPETYRSGVVPPAFAKSSAATQETAGSEDADEDDTRLPEDLPPPVPPKTGSGLDFENWKRAGSRLKNWKDQLDNRFRWALGDWWNSAREDIPHGEKEKFLKKKFGSVMAKNAMNYAPICATITDEAERDAVPAWWVYRELAGIEEEDRQRVYLTYHQKREESRQNTGQAMNRKDLLVMIGHPEREKPEPPKDWTQMLKNDPRGKYLGQMLAETLYKEQLGDADAAQILEYVTAALQGRLWPENAPANSRAGAEKNTPKNDDFEIENFPHGGKMDAEKNADFEDDLPPPSAYAADADVYADPEEYTPEYSADDAPGVQEQEVSFSPSSPSVSVYTQIDIPPGSESEQIGVGGDALPDEEEAEEKPPAPPGASVKMCLFCRCRPATATPYACPACDTENKAKEAATPVNVWHGEVVYVPPAPRRQHRPEPGVSMAGGAGP